MPAVVSDTSRNCFRISRAEDALRGLRQRLEHHMEQEVRLGRLCQDWQDCWSSQYDQLRVQAERLEAHLAAWIPKSEKTPTFSVVGGSHDAD